MFMKTFEEKWTAWVDDQLTGRELSEFLASLPDRAAAEAEKQNAKQVGSLLREQAMALSNADFFSHQLRERLDRENVPVRSRLTRSRPAGGPFAGCFGAASLRSQFSRFAQWWYFAKERHRVSRSI